MHRDVPQRKKWDGATKFFQNFRSLDTTFQKWGGAEHTFSILWSFFEIKSTILAGKNWKFSKSGVVRTIPYHTGGTSLTLHLPMHLILEAILSFFNANNVIYFIILSTRFQLLKLILPSNIQWVLFCFKLIIGNGCIRRTHNLSRTFFI